MSEARSLPDVLEHAHGGSDKDLREKYAEYLPNKEYHPKAKNRTGRHGPGTADPNRPKQPSEYNPERDAAAFDQMDADGTGLHNNRRPPYIIQSERPEHRFLVFLYAQGLSTKEIYLQLGGQWDSERNLPISSPDARYSYQHLHTIRRQAWFQTKLVEYMEKCGEDVVRAKLKAELMPSIDKVIAIRDDVDAPKQLQLKAAESLIDRFLGKAVQQVVTVAPATVAKYAKDAADLQSELDAVESELKNLNPAFLTNENND
jgi:hypothetical protein